MTVHTVMVTVAAAGTPARLTTDTSILASALHVQPFTAAAAVFFGRAGLDKTTGANLIRRFSGVNDTPFMLTDPQRGRTIQLADYYFDVGTNGEKFIVTYWLG